MDDVQRIVVLQARLKVLDAKTEAIHRAAEGEGREQELSRATELMQKWHAERLRLLEIEKAKAGDDFWAGWRAGVQEMERDLPRLGELGANAAKSFRDGMADALTDSILGIRNLQDALRAVALDIARMGIRHGIQQMFTGLLSLGASAAGGGGLGVHPSEAGYSYYSPVGHGGGVLGLDTFPRRRVPAAAFAGADRLHGGIGPGERPAVIRDDEGVFTPGQMRALGRGMRGAASGNSPQLERIERLLERTLMVQERIAARDDLLVIERQELGAQVQRDRRRRGGLSQVLRGRD